MSRYRRYWDDLPLAVPEATGAAAVMDCPDLRDAFDGLGLTVPLGSVLDVGCGTGRFARWCREWTGADVSERAVAYCRERGLLALLIDDAEDLPPGWWDWVVCFSVFTHIGRPDRRRYLRAFSARADRLVVDILPGPEGGDVGAWYASPVTFGRDLRESGWVVRREYDRVSPDGVVHRYYRCERRG